MKKILFSLLLLIHFASAQNLLGKNNPAQFTLDTAKIKRLVENGQHILDFEEINKIHLDSVLMLANQAFTRSEQVNSEKWQNEALLLKSQYYLQMGDTVAYNTYSEQVLNNYHRSGEFLYEAEAYTLLAELFYNMGGVSGGKKSLLYFNRALSIYKQHHSLLNVAFMTQERAYDIIYRLNDTTGYNEIKNSIVLFKHCGYPRYYECEFVLAEHYWDTGEANLALHYWTDAMKGAQENHDKSEMVYGYGSLGLVYSNLNMYAEAIKYYKMALDEHKEIKHYDGYYVELSNYISALLNLNQQKEALLFLNKSVREIPPVSKLQKTVMYSSYGNCMVSLHRYAEAEKYYIKMVTTFESLYKTDVDRASASRHIKCYEFIANFYLKINQFEKARFYYQKILAFPAKDIRPVNIGKIQHSMFKIDSAEGKFISAIDHFEKSKQINDSIFNANKTKLVSELNIKYETSQRLQAIKLLNSQKKEQNAELKRSNLQRNIISGSAVMLLIIAALAYLGYRQKQKSNKLLELQRKEIDGKNSSLEILVQEKDWLLKEVHHRVKNNLQIVMSLLSTQSAFLKNNAAKEAIKESQNRVRAISLLHQKLYTSSNMVTIRMQSYVRDLIDNLKDCFDTNSKRITYYIEIDDIELDLSQAVPLGLILNEAITNAIKYAFADKNGNIAIILKQISDDRLKLTVADDGRGLPGNFNLFGATSLGMEMMKALAKQLDGTLNISSQQGVELSIEFKYEVTSSIITHNNSLAFS